MLNERPYVLAVWLGFFTAGLLIPNGYMPSVAWDGSLQFILCSATSSSLPSDSTNNDSNNICPFAVLHGSGMHSSEVNRLDVRSVEQQHSALNHQATITRIYARLARGPPEVS
ncbi:MAG: hypothetical protein L7U49_03815 [Litoricolaceae bacterium]|nr:hypothetical protein [Litorivicinaceae bacterium]